MAVKKALEPYAHVLARGQIMDFSLPVKSMTKTKDIYLRLINVKSSDVESEDMCPKLTELCNIVNISIETAFRNQLCSKMEIKLREHNFKVMYGILPCNRNLAKWRIRDNSICDICDSVQDIEHLLFRCHMAVNLWTLVENTYDISIGFGNIVCGFQDADIGLCNTVTLISYLLYKEWLVSSLHKKERPVECPYYFYLYELKLRRQIFTETGLSFNLDPIISKLEALVRNRL